MSGGGVDGSLKKDVKGYFQQAIEVMKDDGLFYKEFCRFIKGMPLRGDMTMVVFDQMFGELQVLEREKGKDTSKIL